MYSHQDDSGNPLALPVGKVVCVGRNYLDHIDELNNEIPAEPLLFMKPSTALCYLHAPIHIPIDQGECHNELEIAVLINSKLTKVSPREAAKHIAGVGLALDLTLRDVQQQAKRGGLPWERAKAFDCSCPVSGFIRIENSEMLNHLEFSLSINSQLRQSGNSALMIRDTLSLISAISHVFTLNAGDIVLTGTPKGVGPLNVGDHLRMTMTPWFDIHTHVAKCEP